MPEHTRSWLLKSKIGVLVIDALWRTSHFSHYSLTEALAVVRELRPERTLIIGMVRLATSCESPAFSGARLLVLNVVMSYSNCCRRLARWECTARSMRSWRR